MPAQAALPLLPVASSARVQRQRDRLAGKHDHQYQTVTVPNGTVEIDAADNTFSDVNRVVANGLFGHGFENSGALLSMPELEE